MSSVSRWVVQPDPATAAAALQKGEVDWLGTPLDRSLPDAAPFARRAGRGERSVWLAAGSLRSTICNRRSTAQKLRRGAAAGDRRQRRSWRR